MVEIIIAFIPDKIFPIITNDNISVVCEYAFTKFFSLMWQMLLIIWYLITGKLSISNLSGPIGIFTTVKEASKYFLAPCLK